MDWSLVTEASTNDREITEKHNLAAGAIECGALCRVGRHSGRRHSPAGGNVWTALALFLLGQCALVLMGRLYQRWSGYDVAAEIRSATSPPEPHFAMTLVALSLLMLKRHQRRVRRLGEKPVVLSPSTRWPGWSCCSSCVG